MKIVVCNMGYSGYWVACWRELARRSGVDLKIFSPETRYPYSSDFLEGLPITIVPNQEMESGRTVGDKVVAENPDVLILGGWASKVFRSLVYDRRLSKVRKILIIDSAWTGSIRQLLSRFVLHRLLKHISGIIVGGERGRQYAKWLGFRPSQIFTSIYGYDADAFAKCLEARMAEHEKWPNRFCYVGRYVEVKGLGTLINAYKLYSMRCREELNDSPWTLDCYGKGPLGEELNAVDGVVDHGFIQPEKLPEALINEGVFVLPSLHEPWGVALVEAAGAGLPIICSDCVASGVEVVRPEVNGIVFPAGNSERLARALLRMHNEYSKLSSMGEYSKSMARAYAPDVWCDRWMEAIHVLGR